MAVDWNGKYVTYTNIIMATRTSYSFPFSDLMMFGMQSFTEKATILDEKAACAKPVISLISPIPTAKFPEELGELDWRLCFKIQAYVDEAGTQLISTVDSSVNSELFQYSFDNGLTWRDFPANGLPKEQYGALVRARVEIGPRKQVWLKASVGAEDT
ncbi:MAG: hypothetical protein C4589_11225 [Peptococcaceae bacterium]|jgi:hypothetical protein|nr:MAG: hypothetical protein C4589_11225 [Peptococcaceae bacterium]